MFKKDQFYSYNYYILLFNNKIVKLIAKILQ